MLTLQCRVMSKIGGLRVSPIPALRGVGYCINGDNYARFLGSGFRF